MTLLIEDIETVQLCPIQDGNGAVAMSRGTHRSQVSTSTASALKKAVQMAEASERTGVRQMLNTGSDIYEKPTKAREDMGDVLNRAERMANQLGYRLTIDDGGNYVARRIPTRNQSQATPPQQTPTPTLRQDQSPTRTQPAAPLANRPNNRPGALQQVQQGAQAVVNAGQQLGRGARTVAEGAVRTGQALVKAERRVAGAFQNWTKTPQGQEAIKTLDRQGRRAYQASIAALSKAGNLTLETGQAALRAAQNPANQNRVRRGIQDAVQAGRQKAAKDIETTRRAVAGVGNFLNNAVNRARGGNASNATVNTTARRVNDSLPASRNALPAGQDNAPIKTDYARQNNNRANVRSQGRALGNQVGQMRANRINENIANANANQKARPATATVKAPMSNLTKYSPRELRKMNAMQLRQVMKTFDVSIAEARRVQPGVKGVTGLSQENMIKIIQRKQRRLRF